MREEVAPGNWAKAWGGGGGGGDAEGGGVVEPLPQEVPEVVLGHLGGVRCLPLQDACRESDTFSTSRIPTHLNAPQYGLLKYRIITQTTVF